MFELALNLKCDAMNGLQFIQKGIMQAYCVDILHTQGLKSGQFTPLFPRPWATESGGWREGLKLSPPPNCKQNMSN